MVSRYVLPEVERRKAAGTFRVEAVTRFQVLFGDERDAEVRLNQDVGGSIVATATRAIAAGEEVAVDDISGISEYTPRDQDAAVPHVTAFAHRGGWSIVFEFGRGGHSDRFEFFHLGIEYLETAREALQAARLRPAIDNAFSACELLAKAELLSNSPTVEVVLSSSSHNAVARPYHTWAKLGNTDVRFAKLLGRLTQLRVSARYRERDLGVDHAGVDEILELLEEMRSHVEAQLQEESHPDEANVFYVYATRAIQAGEIVRRGDFSIYPLTNTPADPV